MGGVIRSGVRMREYYNITYISILNQLYNSMKTLSFIAILTLLLFSSCSSPLDKKIKLDTADADMKAIMQSEKIDSSDKELISTAFLASAFSGESIEGKTYKELLAESKKEKLEREKLEAEEKQKEADRIKRLTGAVDVVFLDKRNSRGDYSTYSDFKISIVNKSNQAVDAVQGVLVFNDILGNEIKKVRITHDESIPAGESNTQVYSVDINRFIDEDVTLHSKEYEKLKMMWQPEKILLADGTILE